MYKYILPLACALVACDTSEDNKDSLNESSDPVEVAEIENGYWELTISNFQEEGNCSGGEEDQSGQVSTESSGRSEDTSGGVDAEPNSIEVEDEIEDEAGEDFIVVQIQSSGVNEISIEMDELLLVGERSADTFWAEVSETEEILSTSGNDGSGSSSSEMEENERLLQMRVEGTILSLTELEGSLTMGASIVSSETGEVVADQSCTLSADISGIWVEQVDTTDVE